MANISQITLLDGVTYNLKDSSALASLSLSGNILTLIFRDESTTTLTLPTGTTTNVNSLTPANANSGDIWFIIENEDNAE